jgi:hypothetical protein
MILLPAVMKMKIIALVLGFLVAITFTTFVPSLLVTTSPTAVLANFDQAGEAPLNPHAAQSPWGQFHRNGYAQASTPLRGMESSDEIKSQYLPLSGWCGTPPNAIPMVLAQSGVPRLPALLKQELRGYNLLYGVGRGEKCNYVYRGLDHQTGHIAFSIPSII